jgi:hypothetical protein
LYKDHLLLWTVDGDLLQSPIARVIAAIRRTYSEELALAAYISLFRNDWKGGIQTAALTRVDSVKGALAEVATAAAGAGLLTISSDSFEAVDVESIPGFVLSVSIYGNHAFIASSEGLFETNVNPRYLHGQLELVHRLDRPVHAVETNYGAIAAAAFEEGLWFDRIDFGEGSSWLGGGPMDQVADYSRSISMASRDLLNFTDELIPDLYVAEASQGRQSDRSRFSSWQVTGYHRAPVDLSALSAGSLGLTEDQIQRGSAKLISNSNQRLLFDIDGSLQLLRLKTLNGIVTEPDGVFDVRLDDVTGGSPTVSALPLADGFLLETQNQLSWVDSAGLLEITDSAVVNVRTFPNSRHFTETALIVEDQSATLVGFLDFP